jgi:hypothetical protein
MHKFLIYLSVYFCLTYFRLSFSPSSETGVQFWQWFKSPGYGVSAPHVSGFLLAHLQRQVYNFGSGSSLLGMVSALHMFLAFF